MIDKIRDEFNDRLKVGLKSKGLGRAGVRQHLECKFSETIKEADVKVRIDTQVIP